MRWFPLLGGRTEAQGRVKVKWPVVCGLAGRMPGSLTTPPTPPHPFPGVPSALLVSTSSPAPACCQEGRPFFQEGAVVAGPWVEGAASGQTVAIVTLASLRELGENSLGEVTDGGRGGSYL